MQISTHTRATHHVRTHIDTNTRSLANLFQGYVLLRPIPLSYDPQPTGTYKHTRIRICIYIYIYPYNKYDIDVLSGSTGISLYRE